MERQREKITWKEKYKKLHGKTEGIDDIEYQR